MSFLKNVWYVMAASSAVAHKPVGLRRLGEDFVLWRDQQGSLVAQSSYCPHRGVNLALGKVVKGCLECPYHGFQFAPEGQCVAMPCEGDSAHISPHMRVRRYVTQEAHGLIWLWWGEALEKYPPVPWFEGLADQPRRWAQGEMTWDVPFTRAAESMMDVHHLAFAHGRVSKLMGMGQAKRMDALTVTVIDGHADVPARILSKGALQGKVASGQKADSQKADGQKADSQKADSQKTDNQKSGQMVFTNELVFPNLSIFDVGVGGIILFVSLTPVDEENSWACFRYYTQGLWPWLARAIARLSVWVELKFVQPDDYRLIKSSHPRHSGLFANQFVAADKTIVQWHRLYKQRQHQQQQQHTSAQQRSSEKLAPEKLETRVTVPAEHVWRQSDDGE